MKILVIEDEVLVATMLADAVKDQGHDVTVAHDGEEGLVLWQQTRPDAVFLDLRLGELSGIDVLRHIRRQDPGLPVVVITGHAGPRELKEVEELGVTDILAKPFILNQLSDALASLAGKRAPPTVSDYRSGGEARQVGD